MERLLGRRFWKWVFGTMVGLPTLAAAAKAALPHQGDWLPDTLQVLSWLPIIFGAFLFVMYRKGVWRRIWCLPLAGGWLRSNVFPDLNGEWQISTSSNWPRVKAIFEAAKTGEPYSFDSPPPLGNFDELTATIDQDWTGVRMTIHRPVQMQGSYVIDRSETISFDLIRPTSDEKHPRIAYFYRQENRAQDMNTQTSDRQFLGAAVLRVLDDNILEGDYMTNQGWEKGLNVAGKVRMTRIAPKVPTQVKLAGS